MIRWTRPDRRELLDRVRLLSTLRAAKHQPVDDPIVWWQQITDIATEHGIALPTIAQWSEAGNPDLWEVPL